MREEVFMAGLGGQGVLLAGQVLAQAAADAGLEASWFPAYTPEVRGGQATCTVVIAEQRVGSPIAGRPRAMLLLEPVLAEEHLPRCAPGGLVVLNTSLGVPSVLRSDVKVVMVAATELAQQAGSEQVANLVMLGAYLGVARPELLASAAAALEKVLPERHHRFIPMNMDAIQRGAAAAREQV